MPVTGDGLTVNENIFWFNQVAGSRAGGWEGAQFTCPRSVAAAECREMTVTSSGTYVRARTDSSLMVLMPVAITHSRGVRECLQGALWPDFGQRNSYNWSFNTRTIQDEWKGKGRRIILTQNMIVLWCFVKWNKILKRKASRIQRSSVGFFNK